RQYGKQLPVCGFEPINPVKPNLKTKGDGTDEGDGMAAAAAPPPHHDGIARGLDLEAALVAEAECRLQEAAAFMAAGGHNFSPESSAVMARSPLSICPIEQDFTRFEA
ncbi:unnamed protein product, partial [Urochloa humidicola]